jgi:uncharacterized protein YdaU (DUF1376 family)
MSSRIDKTDIWMPLYIGDYIAATTHLSAEESGAYLHLLMHEWKNGSLPADTESLRRIARVERDAWSNAWAVLERFFDHASGIPIQMNLERIRNGWNEKKAVATEKATNAAKKRWKDAPSNAQALPQPCPSSSPSPIKQLQKPSRDKREGELSTEEKVELAVSEAHRKAEEKSRIAEAVRQAKADMREKAKQAKRPSKSAVAESRHKEFKSAVALYWQSKNPEVEMPWGGPEGQALEIWLRECPATNVEQFRAMLRNRFKSDVNHTDRPSTWIRNISSYAEESLDRYSKPRSLGDSNGSRNNSKTGGNLDAAAQAIRFLEQADRDNQASDETLTLEEGGAGFEGDGSGRAGLIDLRVEGR